MSGATLISRFAAVCLLLIGLPGIAEEAAAPEDPNAAVWQAASAAMLRGPQTIDLLEQAKIQLPEGYGFVPHAQAERVMEAMVTRRVLLSSG